MIYKFKSKEYIAIKEIGQGGTGKTVLVKDPILNEYFVCKKYSTIYPEDQPLYYENFLDEIKLLHLIYHKNIVRVFSYYLYHEKQTGYILMEYVNGTDIYNYLKNNPDKIEGIFTQIIEGFKYLEEIKVLHRDIRPSNIMVTADGTVKIIDFGFGKEIDFSNNEKSISLNWIASKPNEFNQKIYNTQTEIYFVGKMFEDIINNIPNISFKYKSILNKMIVKDNNLRIKSFFDVYREIINTGKDSNNFNMYEKIKYKKFANILLDSTSMIATDVSYNSNLSEIIQNLKKLHSNSILEEHIQNPDKLIRCFLNGTNFNYFPDIKMDVGVLETFIELLDSISENKKKIIFNNLWERFNSIERYYVDDLPF